MSTNQSLLRKADLAIADMQSSGGLLQPEEGNSFIRKLIKQPTLLRQVRTVEMLSPQRKIDKIGFGSRIMRKATQGTALSQGQRSKPTTEQVTLTTAEQIAEVRIPYDVMEDNIERAAVANNEASTTGPGGLRQTIIELIAERSALDLEELGLLAATSFTSGDADEQAYLNQFNGYLKNAETNANIADVGGALPTKAVFKAGVKAMPDQYLRNKAGMKHLISIDQELEFRDSLADRGTALGDSAVTSDEARRIFGSAVEPVSLMPDDKGFFVNPLNFIFGIQRDVSLEFDKSITERVYIIVLTCRVAFQIEEDEAVVVYNNIGIA